jgi:hypothetical protein
MQLFCVLLQAQTSKDLQKSQPSFVRQCDLDVAGLDPFLFCLVDRLYFGRKLDLDAWILPWCVIPETEKFGF